MAEFEPIPEAGLRRALEAILALPGTRHAGRAQVDNFLAYLRNAPIQWQAIRPIGHDEPSDSLFVMTLPGGAVVVMPPDMLDETQQERVRGMIESWIRQRDEGPCYYVQALIEPEARGRRNILERCGFARLTQLLYLDRDALHPWCDPPAADGLDWLSHADAGDAPFAELLPATYEDSLDCPELTGIRPIEAVLASHKATGRFDPSLWEIARLDGEATGCLLLAPVLTGSALEVVYMGVASRFRGRGVGALLLRRALERCRAARVERLMLVVDDRNVPARKLYARFGLETMGARDAYLLRF